ncbi:MAG: hypothetical protein ABSF23_11245 [Terracidiphilus sp.]
MDRLQERIPEKEARVLGTHGYVAWDFHWRGRFSCYTHWEVKSRYDKPMRPKPQSPEYKAFENLLGEVLTVSKAELNRRIEADKREKRTPKSASRVSAESATRT